MTNIVLAGGIGKRLWPMSNKYLPKQFNPIFESKSLFQLTLERNKNICKNHHIILNEEHYFLAKDQSSQINDIDCKYLLESISKNTATSIALSCIGLKEDEIVLITPSDHLIKNLSEYRKTIKKAKKLAREDHIITFGIRPTEPNTEYGYIHMKSNIVKSFYEKPDIKQAEKYLKNKNYYWNSGIICSKAKVILKEIKKYSPDIYKYSLEAFMNSEMSAFQRFRCEDLEKLPNLSIDYSVMEKSKKIKMIPCSFYWNDLGSFIALDKEMKKDKYGNTNNKKFDSINSKRNFIYTQNSFITAIDVQDLIIVESNNNILISKKESEKKVKDFKLKSIDCEKKYSVYRPWGLYTILEHEDGYKVKRLEIKPHKRISLQRHKYRSEHWAVVYGIATVRKSDEIFSAKVGESLYISKNELHRLENNTNEILIIIEIQIGNKVCEEDIERFDDDFGRIIDETIK